ncbi:MAG: ABC transporter permease, partial [Candidatus Rokuibacteriota bacterium]
MVVVLRAASVIAFVLLWEWAARVPISFNFPSPWATLTALVALLRSGAILS